MKTYPMKLGGGDGMPTSLFDPRWKEPAVAARVAFSVFCRAEFQGELRPLVAPLPPPKPELTTVQRSHLTLVEEGTLRFKGGSYGELHRHYAFGKYTVNFHAQAVCFGCDTEGRWFVHATVGRFDGPWGNDAQLVVTFLAGGRPVGAAIWQADLDPVKDVQVRLVGQDPTLAARFAHLDRAVVAFTARHGKDVPPKAEQPKVPRLSRARRTVVVTELRRALTNGDTARLKKLLASIPAAEAREVVVEAASPNDVDAVLALLEVP